MAAAPEKALVLAVTKKMLYGENPPLVGVGLVYKPHYISPVPFSAAYMQLNVWHSAGSNEESEDKLTASHLLFVNIPEMSDVIPVVIQHPVLLDVASKEAMEDMGEPMSPLSLRDFRLHTIWSNQPGGELAPWTLNLHPDDPASHQVKATLQKFQWATSLKVNLPLVELEAAWEDMEEFLQSHLREISSQTKSWELIEELSQKLSAHTSRVWELVQVTKLGKLEVFQ